MEQSTPPCFCITLDNLELQEIIKALHLTKNRTSRRQSWNGRRDEDPKVIERKAADPGYAAYIERLQRARTRRIEHLEILIKKLEVYENEIKDL